MLMFLFSNNLKNFTYGIVPNNSSTSYFNYLVFTFCYLLSFCYRKTIFTLLKARRHLFHLVTVSPWPFFSSVFAFSFFMSLTFLMHNIISFDEFFIYCIYPLIFAMMVWWSDIVREATFLGYHTLVVQRGLRYGVILFIVTEVFFFFWFFLGFFSL